MSVSSEAFLPRGCSVISTPVWRVPAVHYASKADGGVEEWLLTLLTSAPEGAERSPSCINRFTIRKRDPEQALDAMKNRKHLFFIWFVRLLALRPLLAYCASLG
jgi:hypothetical protein